MKPFTNCGTNFEGAFEIKLRSTKEQIIIKANMCAFVCFAAMAVHLEVVSDLLTKTFYIVLKDLYHVEVFLPIYFPIT